MSFSSNQTYKSGSFTGDQSLVNTVGIVLDKCQMTNAIIDYSGAKNLTIADGCQFINCQWVQNTSVYDVQFLDSTWLNGQDGRIGILGYVPFRLQVRRCQFTGYWQPIHLFAGSQSQSQDVLIADNVMRGTRRNDIEIQFSARNYKVIRNLITARDPNVAKEGGMGISFAAGMTWLNGAFVGPDTIGALVAGNVIDLSGIKNPNGAQIVPIEFMGSGGTCSGNYFYRADTGIVFCQTGCSGAVPWHADYNTMVACQHSISAERSNNGYVTCLPPTNPTGNQSFAALNAPGCPAIPASGQAWSATLPASLQAILNATPVNGIAPTNPTPPVVTPQPPANAVTGPALPALTATVTSDTTCKISGIPAAGTLSIITTGDGKTVAQIPVIAGSAVISNLHPGWRYTYSVAGAVSIEAQQTGSSVAQYSGVPRIPVSTTVVYANGLPAKTTTAYSDGTIQ